MLRRCMQVEQRVDQNWAESCEAEDNRTYGQCANVQLE